MQILKIKKYIFLIAGLSILSLVIITFISCANLQRGSSKSEYLVEAYLSSIYFLQNAESHFAEIDAELNNLALYSDQESNIKSKDIIERNFSLINHQLEQYSISKKETGTITQQEYDSINNLSDSIQNYFAYVSQVIALGMVNDRDAMSAALQDSIALKHSIKDMMQMLNDLNYALAHDTAAQASYNSSSSTMTLITIAVFSSVILLVLAAVIAKKLNYIDEDPKNPYMRNIKKPNISNTSIQSGEKSADLLLSEFSKQISDLKVIVYDLSKITKNLK